MTPLRLSNPFLEQLFHFPAFGQSNSETDSLFESAVLFEVERHASAVSDYSQFISGTECLSGDKILQQLPGVPVQVFKELGASLRSVESTSQAKLLRSSGTSGIASSIYVDRETSRRQALAMARSVGDFIGTRQRPFLIADTQSASSSTGDMAARAAATVGYMRFASRSEYLLNQSPTGELVLADHAVEQLRAAEADNEPILLFGFTYVLYEVFLKSLEKTGSTFRLPPGSQVLHIGGWKKLEQSRVSPKMLVETIDRTLGVPHRGVIDVYGFTEQMGLNYPTCEFGNKHVPIFSRLRVLDPVTRKPLANGHEGLLEFTTPIPSSYPGNRVITDDLGVCLKTERCECGRYGQVFSVTGRRKHAEIRGCGDVLGHALGVSPLVADESAYRGLRILFPSVKSQDVPEKSKAVAALQSELSLLSQNAGNLLNVPLREIIEVVGLLHAEWAEMASSGRLRELRDEGLGFLVEWTHPDNLRRILANQIRGGAGALDAFQQLSPSGRKAVRAHPVGLVMQWVSGNVPLLAMFPIVQAWITRNPIASRLSARSGNLILDLLEPLEALAHSNETARHLLHSTLVLYFDSDARDLHVAASRAASARIAWGGLEATRAISDLPRQPETRDLIFGPRTSFAVLHEEAIVNDRTLVRICRRLAVDAFVFNQAACASPHTLFVASSTSDFRKRLLGNLENQMDLARERFGDPEVDSALAAQIQLARDLAKFSGQARGPDDLAYTLLEKRSDVLSAPTFGRTLVVEHVDDVMDVVKKVSSHVQTVGIALPEGLKWPFVEEASRRGVARFTDFGAMTNFDDPWDGVFMLDSLIRYTSIT